MKTAETWGAEKKLPTWKTRVAVAFAGWAAGKLVTEREFDEALARALATPIASPKK